MHAIQPRGVYGLKFGIAAEDALFSPTTAYQQVRVATAKEWLASRKALRVDSAVKGFLGRLWMGGNLPDSDAAYFSSPLQPTLFKQNNQ